MKTGIFINGEDGQELHTEPAPDTPFPIRCGPWPNKHDHCIQRLCSCCGDQVGISSKGLAYHDALPESRPLLCGFCFFMVVSMTRMIGEEEPHG